MLVDDHIMFRDLLKQALSEEKDIEIRDEASNGEEALAKIYKNSYDVILLDLSMPHVNGLAVLNELKETRPDAKVLVLSMYSEDQYAVRAFKYGASGYIRKNETIEELKSAIRKVAAGGKYINAPAAEQLLFQMKDDSTQHPHHRLATREYQVLCLIGSGKTVKEIAKQLDLSISTISTLRSRILKKMEKKNNAELTKYVLKEGLLD
jgi:two-component system invasion response regulator UvrY